MDDDSAFCRQISAQCDAFLAKVQEGITAQTNKLADFQARMEAHSKEIMALAPTPPAPG